MQFNRLLYTIVLSLAAGYLNGQNIGINTDGTAAETNVMLHVKGALTNGILGSEKIFQITTIDPATAALKLRLGLRTHGTLTAQYGWLDLYDENAGIYRNLALQPQGGSVSVGGTSAPGGSIFAVKGVTQDPSQTVVDIRASNTSNVTSALNINIDNSIPEVFLKLGGANGSPRLSFASDNSTQAMTILPNGNVGINQTNPGVKFNVVTSTNMDGFLLGDGTRYMRFMGGTNCATCFTNLSAANDNAIIFSNGTIDQGRFIIAPWGNNGYGLSMNATNGSVGINTTSATTALDVQGVFSIRDGNTKNRNGGMMTGGNTLLLMVGMNDGSVNRFGGAYTQADQGGFLRFDTRAGEPLFAIWGRTAGTAGDATSNKFVVTSDGKVGVGLTGPSTNLHVSGSSGSTLRIVDGNQGTGKVLTSDANGVASWANITGGMPFGDCSDGNVTLDGATNYNAFSGRTASTYTLTRDLYANNLTINTGVTLLPNGYYIYVCGTLTTLGTGSISAAGGNGANGYCDATAPFSCPTSFTPAGAGGGNAWGAGGYAGGGGSDGTNTNAGGTGATITRGLVLSCGGGGGGSGAGVRNDGTVCRGNNGSGTGGFGGGGNGGRGGCAVLSGGPASCTVATYPIAGGIGGGGGGIVVIYTNTLTHAGSITARGGNGGNSITDVSQTGAGGGGGGGVIILVYKTKSGAGTITVAGGSAGTGGCGGTPALAGSAGTLIEMDLQ